MQMTEVKIIYLTGRTGKKYSFYTFPGPESLKAEGGIYAITRRAFIDDAWEHEVLKIAHTQDLSELKALLAQAGHDCGVGANCVAARLENDELRRKRTAEDLWGNYFPSMLSVPA